MSIANFVFDLPEDWRRRMTAGANFRVELVLHVDDVVETKAGPRWKARWLEVTQLSD